MAEAKVVRLGASACGPVLPDCYEEYDIARGPRFLRRCIFRERLDFRFSRHDSIELLPKLHWFVRGQSRLTSGPIRLESRKILPRSRKKIDS